MREVVSSSPGLDPERRLVTTPDDETVRYVIGIDGGGTGTRARLARRNGDVLSAACAGPSALAQGVAQAWANVEQVIVDAFSNAGIDTWHREECAVGIGL